MPQGQKTGQEQLDIDKARAVAGAAAMATFNTALTAAKALVATANTTAIADGGAAAGTKSDILAANTAVAALTTVATGAYFSY